MSDYNDDNKDGNVNNQLKKIVKKDPMYPEKTKFNIFDIIGTLVGVLVGGLIIPIPILNIIIGGAAGYLLTPYFVPKFFRWLKNRKKDSDDY